jgi:CheY-like chemotaxis protein
MQPHSEGNGMQRVLVIDDDALIAKLLDEALTTMGYQVRTASGGSEGLQIFQQEAFDLVITDVIMPGMDGHTVAKKIRSSDRPWTPIIGISGTPWLLDGEFDSVLAKPFGFKALGVAVASLLSATQTDQAASGA